MKEIKRLPIMNEVHCAICGRPFYRSQRQIAEGLTVCAGCMVSRYHGTVEPMIQIEQGEHKRLLRLYYASFEYACNASQDTWSAVEKAFDDCNHFFEGGSQCRL